MFSPLSLPRCRPNTLTGQAGQGRAGVPQDPLPARAAPLGLAALLPQLQTGLQTGLLHEHPCQCSCAPVLDPPSRLCSGKGGGERWISQSPTDPAPAAGRSGPRPRCRWRAERGGAASEGRALPGRVPACEHAAPGGGGIPRPGRGRFALELAPGREEERALPEAAERRRRWEPAVPRGQRCSWVTAAGARRLRCQRAGAAGRELLRGGGSRASSRRSPAFSSALGAVSRRGPRSVPASLRRPPGGCGRHRCHGAAHAGVQRLLLGQPGFQGAPQVPRDRAGEDEQVHQGAD